MIFRQLFDSDSSTYTYLLGSRSGGDVLLIDPVREHTAMYVELIRQLGLRLVIAADTHTHADHVTGLGDLRETTDCLTMMGEFSGADCVSEKFRDGESIPLTGMALKAMYTPGHTDDSFSFVMPDRVFTGDCLLIRGSGRTDFQNGDPHKSWDSIVNRLFQLPEETQIYPGHDYKGWTSSSIGEEKQHNPRIAGRSEREYVEIMNGLNLPDPRMMDLAIPANMACGKQKG